MSSYDYIFAGTGAAALSLLCRMSDHPQFLNKRILLLDKSPKTANDRTWCFWEEQPGYFEPVVHHQWRSLSFFSRQFSSSLDLGNYSYKMIRGGDFYQYCQEKLKKFTSLEWRFGHIDWSRDGGLFCDKQEVNMTGAVVFNSIYQPAPSSNSIDLLQHFKGWMIETESAIFDPSQATLMDFRIDQTEGASFVYVLPLSKTKALVEYTLFTEQLLQPAQYDKQLSSYIDEYIKPGKFKVAEEEFGVIPMTSRQFSFHANGVFHIGTAGGQTKASTGYTFRFIQKQSDRIMQQLLKQEPLTNLAFSPGRFHFYDTVLLRLLKDKHPPGDEIFSRLFQCNSASSIFRFLDNETTFPQEMKLISTLQWFPFLKSALRGMS